MQPVRVTIEAMPRDLQEFVLLARCESGTPQGAAALLVIALGAFAEDEVLGSEMISVAVTGAGGWEPSAHQTALIRSQIGEQPFIPRTYFEGTSPAGGYALPGAPLVLSFTSNDYSGDQSTGPFKVFVQCSGADSPRPVTCVRHGDGTWVAEEWSSLLLGVRNPG